MEVTERELSLLLKMTLEIERKTRESLCKLPYHWSRELSITESRKMYSSYHFDLYLLISSFYTCLFSGALESQDCLVIEVTDNGIEVKILLQYICIWLVVLVLSFNKK